MSRARSFMTLLLVLDLGCAGAGGPNATADGSEDTDAPDDDDADTEDEGGIDDGGFEEGGLEEGGQDEGGTDEGGTDDGGPAVEHALGTITLSESHAATGGTATGFVSAAFVPDAAVGLVACTETVAGCEIAVIPDCASGCGEGQYCGFTDACESTCLDICDATCDDDEVCYFAAPGQAACREIESFDAGSLSFTGTTTPITLFPPYVAEGFDTGAPFVPGNDVTVAASGAAAAGFEAFEETFGTTSLLQTALDDVSVADAYGGGDMPIAWSNGTDDVKVVVTVTALDGSYGTVTCEADDGAGTFDVPREALRAAVDGEDASALAVSITRSRTEVAEGLGTKGQLLYAEVKEEGWVQLVTASTESHVIEGCAWGELVCGDECVDVLYDPQNCGGCNEECDGECYEGECWAENTNATCDDGQDNDSDGYYDCDDFDCSMNDDVTVCDDGPGSDEDTNALCDDGQDNDDDGYYDCDDFDCSMNPSVTVCDGAETGGSTDGGGDLSCVGHCGGMAPGGCYCDAACVGAGDCCSDYASAC